MSRGRHILVMLVLALAVVACYVAMPSQPFVNYDDLDFVPENSRVESGLTVSNVLWAFSLSTPSQWHPLTWHSYMLDAQIDRWLGEPGEPLRPVVFKVTNLLLHLANTLLVYIALCRLPGAGAAWRAAAVALLFAVHPLNVESVAWISERKNLVSALFTLLTLIAYAWYAAAPGVWRYLAVWAAFAGAVMGKPSIVPLPAALLLLDFWPLARWRWGDLRRGVVLVLEKLPLLALSLLSAATTMLNHLAQDAVALDLPLMLRLRNVAMSYVRYVLAMVWPTDLAVLYPFHSQWPTVAVLAATLMLLGVTWLALRRRQSQGYLLAGWLWYLGMLVPAVGVVQAGSQGMADRYLYVPMLGLLVMLVWMLADHGPRWLPGKSASRLGAAALLLAAVALGVVTHRQVRVWNDSVTLWSHAQRVTMPSGVRAQGMGQAYQQAGQPRPAMVFLAEALSWEPDQHGWRLMLAQSALEGDRVPLALAATQRVLVATPPPPQNLRMHALRLRGAAMLRQGQFDEASQSLQEALSLDPTQADVRINLAKVLLQQGEPAQAAMQLQQALARQPDDVDANEQMGLALARLNRLPEAVAAYQRALQRAPHRASLYNNLGVALARQGNLTAAVAAFSKGVALAPDDADLRANLERARRMVGP
jgi:tetratricopeptide (TPR) repeat protein